MMDIKFGSLELVKSSLDWVENFPPIINVSTKGNTMKEMNKEDVLKRSLTVYERDILELADEMASSMTDLNAHNYKNFVDARDKFRDKIKEVCDHAIASQNRLEKMKKVIAEI